MLMPIAAATDTPPELDSAEGVSPAPPSPPPPFADDMPLAKPRSPSTCESTLCSVSGSLSSSGAPAAEATALALELDAVLDEIMTGPPALMFRSEYASLTWLTMLRDSAMPTDASPPSVSPCAVVTAEFVCSAFTSTAPLTFTPVPAERNAFTVTLLITTEIAGATDTPPPDAPVFASVVIAFVLCADTVRSLPPLSTPSSAAVVVSSMSAMLTAAPMPTDSAPETPPSAGSADVAIVENDWASIVTAPVPAESVAPEESRAVVVSVTMLIEIEPATPTSPPPAPLTVLAAKTWVDAIFALIVAPTELIAAPAGTIAVFSMRTKLIATPTPTEADPPSETAAPLPPAAPSVSEALVSEKAPAATTVIAPMNACECDFWMLMPIAAATDTPPELVSADGVSAAPPSPFGD